ncbi:MAG: GyrI-like domain-containing protein [Phycisphaerales bacterium]|nr:MAG: GyrI-like domain-containing protein [Phycisphaerales bacterium]
MLRIMFGLLFACLPALNVWAAQPVQDATAPVEKVDEHAITVSETEPARVAYLEHVGPYWTVGPVFKRVQEYMAEHDQPGPMLARYAGDPSAVPPGKLRKQIGFFLSGDHVPQPPYTVAIREAEQAASMFVTGSSATPARYCPLLRAWGQANGYVAVGPVTEIYPFRSERADGAQRMQVQMVVRSRKKDAGRAARSAERRVAEQEAAALPDRVAPAKPARPNAVQEKPDRQSQPSDMTVTGIVLKPVAPVKPVKELVAADQFDRLAEQLIPTGNRIPRTHRVWLGQVVFRVGAVARGIEQVYPGKGSRISALSGALRRRYDAISVNFASDALGSAVVSADSRTDPDAPAKRVIMHDLDMILGEIAVKSADADNTANRLANILQRVCDVVCQQSEPADYMKE